MIEIFSPLRVDICGGTLDCWPLYLLLPQAKTINFGIDLGTRVRLEEREDVLIQLKDLQYTQSFKSVEAVLKAPDRELDLIRPALRFFAPRQGFSLELRSQSPVGGGLGGSSSLLVGVAKAFSQWQKISYAPGELVRLVCNFETRVLKKPAGTQDYISALEGGMNFITYGDEGPQWRSTSEQAFVLNERFFLVDTGQPHHSGLNNWDVIQRALQGESGVLQALAGLGELSEKFEQKIEAGQWEDLLELFEREFALRLQLSPSFSSPEIQALKKLVGQHPGTTLKICGAGGGGCVMVWADPGVLVSVRESVLKQGYKVLDTKFWARALHE